MWLNMEIHFCNRRGKVFFRENSAGSWNQIGGHSVKYMTINGTAERGKVRKNMKRLVAALIDFYLCGFILMFFIIIISAVTKSPISWFLVLFIFCYFFYTFIFDYFFQGNTFGKKCMKIEYIISTSKQKRMKYSVLHGLFKSLGTIIWPICIFFYFILGFNMPYDKILKKYWE